jgi:putative FmdB family regulatory protein
MPIYEFECQKCRKEFEELVRNRDEGVQCPQCQSADVKKLMSAFAFKSGSTFVSSAPQSGCSGCTGGSCHGCK